jgi:catechol 2,3-dioxygenase-like lactoylglutathione lyase family enzyme
METDAAKGLKCGVYEIGVGVSDLTAATAFWKAFGYAPTMSGRLTAGQAKSLYGVNSALTSVRLQHHAAQNGLIRLMHWQEPTGRGLNMAPLRTVGCRWSVHRCADVLDVLNHAVAWLEQGKPISINGPAINVRAPAKGYQQRPFEAPVRSSYNLQVFLPEAQVVVMQRHHIDMGSYGSIAADSLLRTSEGCHMGLVVQGSDLSLFDFYETALGFRRGRTVRIAHEPGYAPSDMFQLAPGEAFTEIDFENPESGATAETAQPGRLRVFMLHTRTLQPDRRADSRPGNLGYSLYTARVGNLGVVQARVQDAGAPVTPMQADEFGTAAFSFTAPDGYVWTLLQA